MGTTCVTYGDHHGRPLCECSKAASARIPSFMVDMHVFLLRTLKAPASGCPADDICTCPGGNNNNNDDDKNNNENNSNNNNNDDDNNNNANADNNNDNNNNAAGNNN